MKGLVVVALMGILAVANGGTDSTTAQENTYDYNAAYEYVSEMEMPSYDSLAYSDFYDETAETSSQYYPEAYAEYQEDKEKVKAIKEAYAQANEVCETYVSTGKDNSAYSDDHETAASPDMSFEEADIVGYWMDSSNENEPKIMQFYMENGTLMYRYYTLIAGNGNGVNLANEVTEFEYSKGEVSIHANQGSIDCLCGNNGRVYISFYYGFDGSDVMINQVGGAQFDRVQ